MGDWRDLDRDQLEKHLEHECKKRGLTRRDLMKGGMGMAAALGLGSLFAACGGSDEETAAPAPPSGEPPAGRRAGAPPAEAPKFTGTLRVIGLGVDLIDPIKTAGETALGFKLAFDVTDSATMVQKIELTQPGLVRRLLGLHVPVQPGSGQSGNFHNEEIAKITNWGADVPARSRRARSIPPRRRAPTATATLRFAAVHRSGQDGQLERLGRERRASSPICSSRGSTRRPARPWGDEPLYTIGPPNNFNMDSMGYNGDVIQKEPDDVDWAELFNASYQGPRRAAQRPGHRPPGRGSGGEVRRTDGVRHDRQHDEGGDRRRSSRSSST